MSGCFEYVLFHNGVNVNMPLTRGLWVTLHVLQDRDHVPLWNWWPTSCYLPFVESVINLHVVYLL